jgi:hypothetical protein
MLVEAPQYASAELDGILSIPALDLRRLEIDFERGVLTCVGNRAPT